MCLPRFEAAVDGTVQNAPHFGLVIPFLLVHAEEMTGSQTSPLFPDLLTPEVWDPQVLPVASFLEENYPVIRGELESILRAGSTFASLDERTLGPVQWAPFGCYTQELSFGASWSSPIGSHLGSLRPGCI